MAHRLLPTVHREVEPFDLLPYWDDAALDRLVPPRKGRAAYVELHNLVASSEGPQDWGPEDLVRIGQRHDVDLRRAFRRERLALYATYLHHAVARGFTEPLRDTLAHLAHTLHLGPADLTALHENAFGRTVGDAVADDCLSVEERLHLYTLQHTLGLAHDAADAAYEMAARERLLVAVARALCDGALSPDEAEEIERLEKALDVRVPPRVEHMLREAANRWHLQRGELPRTDVFVRRLPGEVGHFSEVGTWREVNYARLRVRLRHHREKIHRGETAGLTLPDEVFFGRRWHEGHIEVTNKRLVLLRGDREPVTYGLASLVSVERYRNGIRVAVKGDRSFFLRAGSDNGTLYSILWRVLHPDRPPPA